MSKNTDGSYAYPVQQNAPGTFGPPHQGPPTGYGQQQTPPIGMQPGQQQSNIPGYQYPTGLPGQQTQPLGGPFVNQDNTESNAAAPPPPPSYDAVVGQGNNEGGSMACGAMTVSYPPYHYPPGQPPKPGQLPLPPPPPPGLYQPYYNMQNQGLNVFESTGFESQPTRVIKPETTLHYAIIMARVGGVITIGGIGGLIYSVAASGEDEELPEEAEESGESIVGGLVMMLSVVGLIIGLIILLVALITYCTARKKIQLRRAREAENPDQADVPTPTQASGQPKPYPTQAIGQPKPYPTQAPPMPVPGMTSPAPHPSGFNAPVAFNAAMPSTVMHA